MKTIILKTCSILTMSILQLFAASAFAHDPGESRFVIEPEVNTAFSAGNISYEFQIVDTVEKKVIKDVDLIETHTKKLHLFVFDAALQEFRHEHPEFNGKVWSVRLDLQHNGNYFVWAQATTNDDTEFSTFTRAQVSNGKESFQPMPLEDVRTGSQTNTLLQVSNTKIKAGKMVMLTYKISRTDGQQAEITPYLGANAHIVAVTSDGDELVHVHPMDGNSPTEGMIHATFPVAGVYRLWIQLIDRNELKVIPLSIVVN